MDDRYQKFYQRLQELGFASYGAYLQGEHWLYFKDLYFESHPKVCYCCGHTEFIDLHHIDYSRLGREKFSDVRAVCRDDHELIHKIDKTDRNATNPSDLMHATE